jgi:hypothetical protein
MNHTVLAQEMLKQSNGVTEQPSCNVTLSLIKKFVSV